MERPGRGRRPVKGDFRSRRPRPSCGCMTGDARSPPGLSAPPGKEPHTPVIFGLRCVDRVRLVCTGRRGRDHRRAPAHARSRAPSPVKRTEQRQGVNHFMVLHLPPDDVGREERGGGRRCRQARMHFLFLGRGRLMTSEPWQCTGDERLYLLVLSRRGWQ